MMILDICFNVSCNTKEDRLSKFKENYSMKTKDSDPMKKLSTLTQNTKSLENIITNEELKTYDFFKSSFEVIFFIYN